MLNEEIQKSKQSNIEEIVKVLVNILNKAIYLVSSPEVTKVDENSTADNKTQDTINCDICDFKSTNKKLMTCQMIEENEDCYSCYLCNKYFET